MRLCEALGNVAMCSIGEYDCVQHCIMWMCVAFDNVAVRSIGQCSYVKY